MNFNIILELDSCILTCRIIDEKGDNNMQYAFYLLKDKVRIEQNWYSNESYAEFILKEAGNYSVIGFIKNGSNVYSIETEEYYMENEILKINLRNSIKVCFKRMNYSKSNNKKIDTKNIFAEKAEQPQIVNSKNVKKGGVAIFGSCVTRDLFEFGESGNNLVNSYIARQSIISAVSNPVKVKMSKIKLDSDFKKRCVYYDLYNTKDWKYLKCGTESIINDYLILDLIDERYNLIKIDNSLATYSEELTESRYFCKTKFKLMKKVKTLDGKWYLGDICLEECIKYFAYNVRRLFSEENIIIHKVMMANSYMDSNGYVNKFSEVIIQENKRINEILEYMYSCLIKYLPKSTVIDCSRNFMGDSSHKWGLAPMHFQKEYYIKVHSILCDIFHIDK